MEKAITIIKSFEGCSLTAYKDFAKGIITIGFGSTGDYKEGDTITQEEADRLLRDHCEQLERAIRLLTKVPLNENQLSALISFCYNLGIGSFKSSTLRMKLNRGEYQNAANEFLRWNKAALHGVLVPVAGLSKRRALEKALFLQKV